MIKILEKPAITYEKLNMYSMFVCIGDTTALWCKVPTFYLDDTYYNAIKFAYGDAKNAVIKLGSDKCRLTHAYCSDSLQVTPVKVMNATIEVETL